MSMLKENSLAETECHLRSGWPVYVTQAAAVNLVAELSTLRAQLAAEKAKVATLEDVIRQSRAALFESANQFGDYANQHLAKTPPDTVKAATNTEWARKCNRVAMVGAAAVKDLLGEKAAKNE